jgi:hypothetical protein
LIFSLLFSQAQQQAPATAWVAEAWLPYPALLQYQPALEALPPPALPVKNLPEYGKWKQAAQRLVLISP